MTSLKSPRPVKNKYMDVDTIQSRKPKRSLDFCQVEDYIEKKPKIPLPYSKLDKTFIFGSVLGLSFQDTTSVKRTTYKTRLSSEMFQFLRRDPRASTLYLLGVRYNDGDVQAQITETSHKYENCKTNAIRGAKEELQINIAGVTLIEYGKEKKKKRTNTHLYAEIKRGQYNNIPLSQIHPNKSKDNKAFKASLYLFGTYEDLVPILEAYEDPNGAPGHDKIEELCMIPFAQLHTFI